MGIRKTLRELEEEEGSGKDKKGKEAKPDYQAQLETLVKQCNDTIPKLHTEYNKYFSGAEKKPPIKLREQLDAIVASIKANKKHATTQALNFRVQTALNSYLSYQTIWDKKLNDLEKTSRR